MPSAKAGSARHEAELDFQHIVAVSGRSRAFYATFGNACDPALQGVAQAGGEGFTDYHAAFSTPGRPKASRLACFQLAHGLEAMRCRFERLVDVGGTVRRRQEHVVLGVEESAVPQRG